jgi:hypothetical protein
MSAERNLGYYEFKNHKPWFDKGCPKLLDERKQAKLQWLQDPSEINGDKSKQCKADISETKRENI